MSIQVNSNIITTLKNNMTLNITSDPGYSNVIIIPPMPALIGTQVLICSSAQDLKNTNFSYIKVILSSGSVFIHPDYFILEGKNKLKLGAEFFRWLQEDITFMGEDSYLNMNHYFFMHPNKTYFKLEINPDKEPSPDWLIVKSFYDRYINLKAFW